MGHASHEILKLIESKVQQPTTCNVIYCTHASNVHVFFLLSTSLCNENLVKFIGTSNILEVVSGSSIHGVC